MAFDIVLITGSMVGASSWSPTADWLRTYGNNVQVPDILSKTEKVPAWSSLSAEYIKLIKPNENSVLVGHSMATTLVAELSTMLPVKGIILTDGDIPPATGQALPGGENLRALIKTLADEQGNIPPWSEWWSQESHLTHIGINDLKKNPEALEILKRDEPRVTIDWFDDPIELNSWDHISVGYIQTSIFFEQTASDAEKKGWPVVRIDGTHMHPTLKPEEMGKAILDICEAFIAP